VILNKDNVGNRQWELEILRKRIAEKLKNEATPMNYVSYNRKNYNNLFPNNETETPIGKIQLREDQYSKLNNRTRRHLLKTMHEVYSVPTAIINENRDGEQFKLFGKSYIKGTPKNTVVVGVVNDKNKGKTTHYRRINNFVNNIKNPTDLLYEKTDSGLSGTAGHDPYSQNLADIPVNDTQSEVFNPNQKASSSGTGSNPSNNPVILPATVANSVQPENQLSNLNIPHSDPVVNRENIKKENENALVKGQNIKELNAKMARLKTILSRAS